MSIALEIILPSLNDIDISDPNILRNKAEEITELCDKLELSMNFYKTKSDECYKKHNIDEGKYNEKKVQKCKQEISHFHDFASQLIFRSYNLLNTDPSIINITGLTSVEAITRIEQRINTLKNHGTLTIKSDDSEYVLQEVGHNILTHLDNKKIKCEINSSSIILQLSPDNTQTSMNNDDEITKEIAKEIVIPESYINPPLVECNINQQSSLMEEKEKLLKEGHECRHKIEEYRIEIESMKDREEEEEKSKRIKEIELKIEENKKKSSELLFKAYNIFNDNSSIDIREQSYEESIEYIKNGLKDINNLKELIIIGDGSDVKYMNEIKKSVIKYLKENEKLNVKEDDPHEGWIKIVFDEEIIKINQTPNSSDNSFTDECNFNEENGALKSNSTIPPTSITKESLESNAFPVTPNTSNERTNDDGNKTVRRRRASTAVPQHANNPARNGKDLQCCIVM